MQNLKVISLKNSFKKDNIKISLFETFLEFSHYIFTNEYKNNKDSQIKK